MSIIKHLLIIMSITMLFALTSNETKAQCPSGYTYNEITMNVNGCDYIVQVCVLCGSGPTPTLLRLVGIMQITDPPCTQQWSFQMVANDIRNRISVPNFIQNNFCTQGWSVQPCSLGTKRIQYIEPICWNITKINHFGEDVLAYWPCDHNTYCLQDYDICFNELTQIYDITIHFWGIIGEVDCILDHTQVNEPTKYNEPTECFIYPTPCN